MISHELKCLFVHVHKTGGSSIQKLLAPYASDTYVRKKGFDDLYEGLELKEYPKHDHLDTYPKRLGRKRFDEYFKFGCVRNPWDRAVSWHLFNERYKHGRETLDRDRFLEWLRTYRHLYTASEMLSLDGHLAVDFAVRYERLQNDLNEVLKRLSLPESVLPVTNVTSRRWHYSQYYDEELRDVVARHFRDDIENFGYRFEPGPHDAGCLGQLRDQRVP